MAERTVWLVFTEPISARVLIDCGVIERLQGLVQGRLTLVDASRNGVLGSWRERLGGDVLGLTTLAPLDASLSARIARRVDRELDQRIGFYPTAIRLNLREGFHAERMAPGHRNWFLDSDRVGPLPRTPRIDAALERWTFSPRRHVPGPLLARMRGEASGVVFANLQHHSAIPFLAAGRRLGLPLVANVASWDHTVGKGVIPPVLGTYVVQNRAMRDDLVRYHIIPEERITVTGWPQTDVFHLRRSRAELGRVLGELGLDERKPLVVYMGNTPTNMPYEGALVEQLVERWLATGASERYQLLFRPHPRDDVWETRYRAALGVAGTAVQRPSYSDLEQLAILLQHCDCVVTNAGTVLLDALVNDRPVVCMLSDEGAPPGERWAEKSVVGEHYRELMASGAFLEARSLAAVVDGIDACLSDPSRLAAERRAVVALVVGVVDGLAADRVADAFARGVGM